MSLKEDLLMEHEIVSKLNDAAILLWDGSVRYTVINAWSGVIGWLIVAVAITWLCRKLWRMDLDDVELTTLLKAVCCIGGVVGYLVCLIEFVNSIVDLIEPIGATVNRLL